MENHENSSSVASKDGEEIPADNAAPAEAKMDTMEKTKVNESAEAEITEEKGDKIEETEEAKEGEEGPPPEIHYTLESACEEIDNFLLVLSTKKNNGDDDQNAASFEIPEVVWRFLDLFEEKIPKHDNTGDGSGKWGELQEEDELFLEAVARVTKLAKSLGEWKLQENNSDQTHCVLINRIGSVHQRVMSFLEDEFRSMLDQDYVPSADSKTETKDTKAKQETEEKSESDQPTNDSITNYPGFSQDTVSSLSKIAKQMISAGYESECFEVYMIARRNSFDESLGHIGFEKISIDDVQKAQWESLEREIGTWISTFSQCANVYFSGERKLAEVVFADHPTVGSSLFGNLIRGVMLQLLHFPEALSMTKRSAEKLFKVLDIYEALRDNIPALNALFPNQCEDELMNETTAAKIRLGEAAICMFCDLENSIKSDTGKTTVPGGAVHPLTRYTMNYLKYACEYKNTLEEVFKDRWKIGSRVDTSAGKGDPGEGQPKDDENTIQPSPFTEQLVRVMDLLDQNLEAKSKLYKEVALSSIFLMNNGRYILQKIKGSTEIHHAMGNTWCRKKSSDLRNHHKNYQRETWTKLLGCFGLEGLMTNGKVVKPVLKERFNNFNKMFDEIHRTQSMWVVSDDQLQSELRVSISAVVIPAYRSFVGRFSQHLDPGRQTEKYIKYQPEDIETYIDELFDGKSVNHK